MPKKKPEKKLRRPQHQDEQPGRQYKMKPKPDSGERGYRRSGSWLSAWR